MVLIFEFFKVRMKTIYKKSFCSGLQVCLRCYKTYGFYFFNNGEDSRFCAAPDHVSIERVSELKFSQVLFLFLARVINRICKVPRKPIAHNCIFHVKVYTLRHEIVYYSVIRIFGTHVFSRGSKGRLPSLVFVTGESLGGYGHTLETYDVVEI